MFGNTNIGGRVAPPVNLMSILYTHFIPMFCVLFCRVLDINKRSNALNVHLYD